MNRLVKYCFLMLVAESLYFALRFLERSFQEEKIRNIPEELLEATQQFIEKKTEVDTGERFEKCIHRKQKTKNCPELIQGERLVQTRFHGLEKVNSECSLGELVKDCAKLRYEHGYDDKPVSDEELDFPLAFSIKMHTNALQLERLLRTIYRPHNFYCIHVDLKVDAETFNLIKNIAACFENVVLTERLNIVYSSIRLVAVEFACMKRSFESGVKWKYYINLTGQEFVLRTNLELVKILKIFNGTNDIESYPFTQWFRIESDFILVNDRLIKKEAGRRSFKNTTLFKGSAYGMFTRDFVNFVLTDRYVSEFYQWLNHTYAPEETIWSTLNRLPFAPGGCPTIDIKHDDQTHVSRAVIWAYEPVHCHGKFVRGICIFNYGDLPWLHGCSQIVANKFYERSYSAVLECLEEWVNNKTYSSSLEGVNWYYYRNLPQVKCYNRLKVFQKSKDFFQKRKEIWFKQKNLLLIN